MAHFKHFDEPVDDEDEVKAAMIEDGASSAAHAADDNDDGEFDPHDLQRAVVVTINKVSGRLGLEVRTTKRKGTRILKVSGFVDHMLGVCLTCLCAPLCRC